MMFNISKNKIIDGINECRHLTEKDIIEEEIDDKIHQFFDKLSKEYNIVINYNDMNWRFEDD